MGAEDKIEENTLEFDTTATLLMLTGLTHMEVGGAVMFVTPES